MITLRKGQDRGAFNHGWLDTKHSFSFAHYYDPKHMGFGPLRVINEDRVLPGAGFPTHGHENMEIITYVVDGALEHRDSEGNGSIIRPGDVQRMTAGTGIRHSEFNASDKQSVHFLQIWILPEKEELPPGYQEARFEKPEKQNKLRLVASPDGRQDSVKIHQSVNLYASQLSKGSQLSHDLEKGAAWLQIIRGALRVNEQAMMAGDGAAIENERALNILAKEDAEFLLFDFQS